MNVARPALFYALLALPLFALGFFIQYRRLFPLLRKMSLQKGAFLRTRYFYSGLFGLLTLAALVVAAAGPFLTVKYEEERKGGIDIVFAFDVSRSMNVHDVAYNGETISRLEGAKIVARGVLTALRGQGAEYRYAAAVGKGEGVLAVPLTYGPETVQAIIDSLSSQAISAAGTNVEKLTRAAIGAFPPDLSARYPAEKAVIVFTDGEALSGLFQDAVEKAKEERIMVNAVCIGSEKGGPIPIGVTEKGATLFLQDKSGKNIVSRAEPGALREALEQSNGLFFRVGDTGDTDNIEAALAALRDAFLPREDGGGEENENRRETETRETEKKQDATFIFAALALVFFALHKGAFYVLAPNLTPKSGSRKKRAALKKHLLSAAPFLFLFLSCAPTASFSPFAVIEAKFRLLEGNFFVTRNMLSEAEASYTRSRSLASSGDIPYTLYALGSARLLDEGESPPKDEADSAVIAFFEQAHALITTDAAGTDAAGDPAAEDFRHGHGERYRELAYRIHYNSGVAHYHAGNAEEAAREFRQALLVNPGRIEAKRNLEISLVLLESKNTVETSEVKSARPVREGISRGNSVLFDFIREKETGRWKSWAWQGGEGDSSLDY
ncbi:MAG: VWA domain-containing protein [Spirochaetaceae bacterium]|jgi:Ca-activated chloride channel family protein|nr:VWA domain-containing protein [Spirochaetaceae bacterium]